MEQKILIVDDELHMRLLMEQVFEELEKEGVKLFIAEDGEQALQIIKEEKPDFVVLDIMMPRIDGFEVCNIVKKKMGMHDVFIVLLTAKGQEKDKEDGRKVGADVYITKPFDPDELLAMAEEVLSGKS